MKQQHTTWLWVFLILLICQTAQAHQEMLAPKEKTQVLHQEWLKQSKLPGSFAKIPTFEKPRLDANNSNAQLPKEFDRKVSIRAVMLPLTSLLEPIEQAAGYHVVLGPGVEDKNMSVDIADTSISHALSILLYSSGYGYRVKGNDLIILAEETRVFRIILPPIDQQFSDVTSNESFVQSAEGASTSGSNPNNQQIKLGTKITVENSSKGVSFWDDVQNNLKTLVSASGQFSINKPGGSVVITDGPAYLDRIGQYFDDLNERVTQQIEVDVKVVEVMLNNENRFGVDWNILAQDLKTLNSIGLASSFASSNYSGSQFFKFNADGSKDGSGVTKSGLKLAIDALSKQGKVEVVSQPRLTILNNQVAVIQVGSTQSFVDRTSLETTQTGTITSISTSQVQEGVTMRLLGNIVGEQIYLSVTPVVTTIDNIRSITSGSTTIEAPQTTTKSINTLVKLNEGETVAIGGLITSYTEKSKQGIPIVSKIPILGKLFEYAQNKNNKTELIIFITPKKG